MQQNGSDAELSKSGSQHSPAIQPSSSALRCPQPGNSVSHFQTVEQSYDIIDLVDSDDESVSNQSTGFSNGNSVLQTHMSNSGMR